MEFEVGPALLAGLVGTVAMTAVLMLGRAIKMTSMDIALIGGGMVLGDERRARMLGMAMHVLVTGTVLFGLIYAAIFHWIDSASWLAGLVIGLIHSLVVGLLALPMMASFHPRMRGSGEGFRLPAPGVMGIGYGKGTPLGLLLAHLVYGLVVAVVYDALV